MNRVATYVRTGCVFLTVAFGVDASEADTLKVCPIHLGRNSPALQFVLLHTCSTLDLTSEKSNGTSSVSLTLSNVSHIVEFLKVCAHNLKVLA